MKVGIQGVRASFHDVAARQYFSDQEVHVVECSSFKLLCQVLQDGEADVCLMAIENSIAGSILPNYSLLENYGFKITGETYLRIEMCLLALRGQSIANVQKIQSHPMAILQCEDFLASVPKVQVLEMADTAESAKFISEQKLNGVAAIASRLAAKTYDLEILKEGIETNKQNYTRFLVICRKDDYQLPDNANKASIRFEAPDRAGSLVEVLEILKRHQINMTKIQSVPIMGKPYEYSFHVDLEWTDQSAYWEALTKVQTAVINLIHLGEYRRGMRPPS
jgi:prephenate dehydratase